MSLLFVWLLFLSQPLTTETFLRHIGLLGHLLIITSREEESIGRSGHVMCCVDFELHGRTEWMVPFKVKP